MKPLGLQTGINAFKAGQIGASQPQTKSNLRGLNNLITEIRLARSRDAEEKRVNKEKANIRQKFGDPKAKLKGYDHKKYIAKLIYIFLLGYEVDFGFTEALKLLVSPKFSEKQFGYLALALLLHQEHEMVPLVIHSLLKDLKSGNEFFQSMALHCISSIGGPQMSEALGHEIEKLAYTESTRLSVQKKALTTLAKLYSQNPECFPLDAWPERLAKLLQSKHLSLINAVMTLLLKFAQSEPRLFAHCQTPAISVLSRITRGKYGTDYVYKGVPSPWAQISLMRFLLLYPQTTNEKAEEALDAILERILGKPTAAKPRNERTINHKNARNCVLFEAIKLVIHNDSNDKLLNTTITLLGQMLKAKQPNIRYLGLESMSRLVASRDVLQVVRKHQQTVILALKDKDVSIRKRALDLLYGMCDRQSSKAIVRELLGYLVTAEYDVRQELATKTALLAERFASSKAWYVDVMLELIRVAGEDVPDDVWHRVVRVVLSSDEDVQEYAAKTAFMTLHHPNWNEITLKVAAYILGEFGTLVSEDMASGPRQQFKVLHDKWRVCSPSARALLLNTYAKFSFLYGGDQQLVQEIATIFRRYAASLDEELQQRSAEYLALLNVPAVLERVWDPIPAWEEEEDFEDDGGEQPSTYSAPPQHQQQQQQQQTNAYAAAAAAAKSGPGPAVAGQGQGPTQEALASHDQFYKALWLAPDGFLYKDSFIQVGIKTQQAPGVFHMMLYLGNCAPSAISHLAVTVPTLDYLQFSAQPPQSAEIAVGGQTSQLISVQCMKPFVPSPILQLSFECNGTMYHIPMKLPIILPKFNSPAALDRAQFGTQWTSLSQPEQQYQQVFKASAQGIQATHIRTILRQYNVAVLEGIDPNPANIVGAATLQTAGQTVPVVLLMEVNAEMSMIRLTVRSSDPSVSQTLYKFLSVQLAAPA